MHQSQPMTDSNPINDLISEGYHLVDDWWYQFDGKVLLIIFLKRRIKGAIIWLYLFLFARMACNRHITRLQRYLNQTKLTMWQCWLKLSLPESVANANTHNFQYWQCETRLHLHFVDSFREFHRPLWAKTSAESALDNSVSGVNLFSHVWSRNQSRTKWPEGNSNHKFFNAGSVRVFDDQSFSEQKPFIEQNSTISAIYPTELLQLSGLSF